MIWHIFKKDWKLLWPLVATVAGANIVNAALQLKLGHFEEPHELVLIGQLFPLALFLGIAVLIVMAVHQDAVPGVRQDWLVRPIRRRDLILAKLLFVLVAVHGPMLLADLAHGMATGFAFWDSLSAALSRAVLVLLSFSLPVLALAAMTSTIVEVIGGTLAIWLIFAGIVIAVQLIARGGGAPPLATSGMSWMTTAFWSAVAFAAAIAVVPLQYFRRATMQARSIVFGAVLLVPIPTFTPWAPAFSFQQWFSTVPAAAEAIAVAFDSSVGKLATEPGLRPPANSVWLPVRVSGLPPESIVISDRTEVRLIGRDGAILFRGRTTGDLPTILNPGYGPGPIDDFPVRTTTGGDVRTHQFIIFPRRIYELTRTQRARMELDYSLTLFRINAGDTIAALNGDKRMSDIGWCKTRIDDDGDDIELRCLKTGSVPRCVTVALENTVSGQRDPEHDSCHPDYRPYTAHVFPDAMSRFGGGLRFRDPRGLAKYPVDGSQLADAQVTMKSYQPVAHFSRQLIIPEIRLGDWEAETRETATSATPPSQ